MPVTALKGVGEQLRGRLARLGIYTVQDLLFHLPLRYEDRSRVTPIGALAAGTRSVVIGQIEHAAVGYGRRRSLMCRIGDGTGMLTLRWFYFNASQQRQLQRGGWLRAFGEIRRGPATLEIVHPEYQVTASKPEPAPAVSLTPVYPATEGVTQNTLRRLIAQAVTHHLGALPELVPDAIRRSLGFVPLVEAVGFLHNPPVDIDVSRLEAGADPHQRALAFEELLAQHLSLRQLRAQRQSLTAPAFGDRDDAVGRFWRGLGFTPTGAQRRVSKEILDDLALTRPALRLLQGDVGSGKTVVAAAAAARTAENAWQTAVMAPTELLAEQHYRNFHAWLSPLDIEVVWLTSSMPAPARRGALAAIEQGTAQVAVGTHALFQSRVNFSRLGLLVVDEQHRFGVDQRAALRAKGQTEQHAPHQIVMTATPIPRTLAMTFYADLDVSSIDEMPPGRKPVDTVAVPESRRAEVVARVADACRQGRQVYWVCPLIDESEHITAQAAVETEQALRGALAGVSIAMIHGRMKPADKERVMSGFRSGKTDLLVATTVIEVGVDVPNAGLMVIENAERLGLSQLHQLRGRVGRGSDQAACVLLYQAPLSAPARARLAALRETNDGFEIARRDLDMRGPGEFLGIRQTGLPGMRIADLARDRGLLPQVQSAADRMWQQSPEAVPALVRRWTGTNATYGNV